MFNISSWSKCYSCHSNRDNSNSGSSFLIFPNDVVECHYFGLLQKVRQHCRCLLLASLSSSSPCRRQTRSTSACSRLAIDNHESNHCSDIRRSCSRRRNAVVALDISSDSTDRCLIHHHRRRHRLLTKHQKSPFKNIKHTFNSTNIIKYSNKNKDLLNLL